MFLEILIGPAVCILFQQLLVKKLNKNIFYFIWNISIINLIINAINFSVKTNLITNITHYTSALPISIMSNYTISFDANHKGLLSHLVLIQ